MRAVKLCLFLGCLLLNSIATSVMAEEKFAILITIEEDIYHLIQSFTWTQD